MYDKILLAADGSEHSLRAADQAIELAKQNHSALTLIYVLDVADAKSHVLHNWNSLDANQKRKEAIKAVEAKLDASLIPYETVFIPGDPGPEIVDFANEHKFDLVIIGSRGLNPLQELVLGSVSHKVAKRVERSVLIVK